MKVLSLIGMIGAVCMVIIKAIQADLVDMGAWLALFFFNLSCFVRAK